MAADSRPTNDRLLTALEQIRRELAEVRDAQRQLTKEVAKLAKSIG
jgi:hypothetical protein